MKTKRHEVVQPLDRSIRLIPLTQGFNAIVDASDYDWLMQWSWYTRKTAGLYYAQRNSRIGSGRCLILMHREIINPPVFLGIDHINGNGLDNRRANLRVATVSQNLGNRSATINSKSGLKGVCRAGEKWRASIAIRGSWIHLGTFRTREEAATAYNVAAIKHFGEFARLNEVDNG